MTVSLSSTSPSAGLPAVNVNCQSLTPLAPYDLTRYGYASIPIETPEGRQEYQHLQQELSGKAQLLRARLLKAYQELLASIAP
ncbi:MAG: hypothetical protein WCS70_09090 [Verrucomicrobiota bacterium]